MKGNVRLLYHTAAYSCEESELSVHVKIILAKCSFVDLNSSILTTFKEVDDFYVLFNGSLDEIEVKIFCSIGSIILY